LIDNISDGPSAGFKGSSLSVVRTRTVTRCALAQVTEILSRIHELGRSSVIPEHYSARSAYFCMPCVDTALPCVRDSSTLRLNLITIVLHPN